MKKSFAILIILAVFSGAAFSCKPIAEAKVASFDAVKRTFNCDANRAYYAIRWALEAMGYPVASEDLVNGVIKTAWVATSSDSHYIAPFGHRDYGVSNAYHQIVVNVQPSSGGTSIEVSSSIKSVFAFTKTSYVQENKVMSKVADYLRDPNVYMTNLGVEE